MTGTPAGADSHDIGSRASTAPSSEQLSVTVRSSITLVFADGGVVMDEAGRVRVSQVTAGAVTLALSLAAERFENRPLVVNGTEEFRQQVAALAAVEGLRVRFADSALEQQRLVARARHRGAIDRGRDEVDRGR